MIKYFFYFLFLLVVSCNATKHTTIPAWVPYDESSLIAQNANNENRRLRYKLIQSKIADKNSLWKNISGQLKGFTNADYQQLKPLILEQDIPTLQNHIKAGTLTYTKLTQWYLYRIALFENDKDKALNNIISINPFAVKEARIRDKNKSATDHPIYGIPILLKDNIGFEGLPTTAGAHALANNNAPDAFITKRIKEKGAIILGKTSLSEWANFLCLECPNGYSAIGGQTLNPYGPRIFDTGGSSSGSGSATAANYAAATVGTETSGSILSPSSASSIVGLKPTTGLLSRSGIVPLSSTFDTPGPMTKNVVDNAILLSAMAGEDPADAATKDNPKNKNYVNAVRTGDIKGIRFGVIKSFLKDTLYQQSVNQIVALGGVAIEFEPAQMDNDGFGKILNADMKADLPVYLNKYASKNVSVHSVADVIAFNNQDSLLSIPYGQGRFSAVEKEEITNDDLKKLREAVRKNGVSYFEKPMQEYKLDVILSINNFTAGFAAAANYPCLTVPMGYRTSGVPAGITIIAKPFMEIQLLQIGHAFEQATRLRKLPAGYK
jgi:amidase